MPYLPVVTAPGTAQAAADRPSLATDPDRLLPPDPRTRSIARELLALVEDLPIISPHGHVDASLLELDTPFADPATLLVSPDHYVTRLIHSSGVPLVRLGVGVEASADPREIWREFAKAWPLFDGTASGHWMRETFGHVFKLSSAVNEVNADALFDEPNAKLKSPNFRPRQLFTDFKIEVLATTDDPLDDLAAHRAMAQDPRFSGRVLPTFRPDASIRCAGEGWGERVEALIDSAGDGLAGYPGYLRALENRRAYFVENGAVSADHGVRTPATLHLDQTAGEALFDKARRGEATALDADVFEAHMSYQMARMSVADGLVMTMHPGVFRNHHTESFNKYGPDSGHDIPFAVNYTEALRPMLEDFGTAPGFHFIPYTIDESVFSREIAPLAGFYPSVFIGAPWWFLDAPDAMLRFRCAVTETAGFSRSSGFIDDTRAFCSIPARHNTSRRIEASFLARLVAERRISGSRAQEIIVDIVDRAPRRAFKL